jgi:hypothetical protein
MIALACAQRGRGISVVATKNVAGSKLSHGEVTLTEAAAAFFTVSRSHRRPHIDFDRVERVGAHVFEDLGVPPEAILYICGPAAFMSGLVDGLPGWGVPRDRLHAENFGSGQSMTPGIAAVPRRPPHPPGGSRGGRAAYIVHAAISLSTGVPHSTACSN